MKIKCNYCGNFFDDSQAKCPFCAAPNEGIKRTASDQPLTIEDLKKWYESKGLPPSETTRFFIGIDYKKPRAFGIYKDETTGEVVVYKNKDNGERAIRYKGTDEAYGVNELYQRLKQEIIEQKMNNVKKAKNGSSGLAAATNQSYGKKPGFFSRLNGFTAFLLLMAFCVVGTIVIVLGVGTVVVMTTPKVGYYNYQDNYYYYDDAGNKDKYVFAFDEAVKEWQEPVTKEEDPGIFKKKSTCKKYFLSEAWDSSYGCSEIVNELVYKDYKAVTNVVPGYYQVDSNYYYHYGYDGYSDWYEYSSDDDDWKSISRESLPADLSHPSQAGDFYYTSTWDSSTQFSDFTDSEEYQTNYAQSKSDDSSSDSSDSDYSWDSGDSWDSDTTDWGSDW